MVEEPFWLSAGDMLIRQLGAVPDIVIFPDGIKVVLEDVALTAAQERADSKSPMTTATPVKDVSSLVDLFVTSEIVGASLTGFTVRVKVSAALRVPSVTVKVIVDVPI